MKKIPPPSTHYVECAHDTKSPSIRSHIDHVCQPITNDVNSCRHVLSSLFSIELFFFLGVAHVRAAIGNLTKRRGGGIPRGKNAYKRLTFVTLMKKWRHGHGCGLLANFVCKMNQSRKVRYASDRTLKSKIFF